MQLSPNFSLIELTRTEVRQVDNAPPPEMVRRLRMLAWAILEPVRDHFGKPVIVTSGYRSPKVNALVGGSPTSQHMQCEAVDFVIPGVSTAAIVEFIKSSLVYDQVILEGHNPKVAGSGWVHCSLNFDGINRMQGLVIRNP